MATKYKIKKGDPVVIIAGKDKLDKSSPKLKGAKVLVVNKDKGQVIVEGANIVKRHMAPSQANPDGGIVEKSMPLNISNVMYLCPKCDKGVRLGIKILENGKKVRFCKSCGEVIDKD